MQLSVTASDSNARAATRARAHYNVRDVVLDMRVMVLSDGLLNGLCNRSYTHVIYRHVFGDGTAGDITGAHIREEPEIAEAMLSRYKGVDDFPGKAAAGDLLGSAVEKSLKSRDGVDAAEKAENSAGGQELLARLGVRTALDQSYGMLRAAFPGQRAFVESFFYKRERPSSKADKPYASPGEVRLRNPANERAARERQKITTEGTGAEKNTGLRAGESLWPLCPPLTPLALCGF